LRNYILESERGITLDQIDLFDTERFRSASQLASWELLRAQAPVWPQEGPGQQRFWSVTRYADVRRVLADHRSFSSEHGTILAVLSGDLAGGKTINLMDPPGHTAIRVPTMKLLSTGAMLKRSGRIRELVRELLVPLRAGGVHDIAALLLPLPLLAVGDVIGIPREWWTDIPGWTMAGVAPEDQAYATGGAPESLRAAHYQLFAMFDELVRARRARPREDVISKLAGLEMNGRRLTHEEIILNCYSFVMGANTTTPHVASQLLLVYATQPELWQELRANPVLADGAVEEGLRWATPTNHLVRRVTADVTIAGSHLKPGDLVCAWVASANRDERVFTDPYVFDHRRAPNPHLALGTGIHFCNGGPAARLVLRLLLDELLPVVERFELAGEVSHLRSNFINGITRLPLRVCPVQEIGPARRAVGGVQP
jgi:cytochrome P450